MSGYALPTNTDHVSCSWQCHKNRNPPSSEPGTDYASGHGSPLFAAGNGKVVDRKDTTSGATGRYLTIDLDDGRRVRSLHLASSSVGVGARVSRGQQIGRTGASGFGSEWGYGAHVHQTLWHNHAYNFCSTCTLDYANYVGSGAPAAGNQRVVGANGANGRSEPNTAVPVTQTLPPGTVADFNGWIRGENVSGNNVWFHGMHSGDWFWSGGFTDMTTHDLADLNVAVIGPTQRQAGDNTVNGRAAPTTSSTIQNTLDPGTIGDFAGWINGERVEDNPVWFKGAISGSFFWSGGFKGGANTSNLTDLNPQQPLAKERTVGANSSNGRKSPSTLSPVAQSLSPGTVAEMDAYTKGEVVSQNDIWFRQAHSGDWFWSGGFVGGADIAGLPLTAAPAPANPNNPRGLPEYSPIMPNSDIGLVAPLGDGLRSFKGTEPVTPIIDRAIIHHCGTTVDQLDWFSYKNSRSSCPNKYVRPDGWAAELIRPHNKPATTGPEWNWRSYSWEILDVTGAPQWKISDAAKMIIALDLIVLQEHDGEELDGIPVRFTIDAVHVIGHNQAVPGTECPGPDMDVPGIIALAQQLWDEKYPETPIPPDPPIPGPDSIAVPVSTLRRWQDEAEQFLEEIEELLD